MVIAFQYLLILIEIHPWDLQDLHNFKTSRDFKAMIQKIHDLYRL